MSTPRTPSITPIPATASAVGHALAATGVFAIGLGLGGVAGGAADQLGAASELRRGVAAITTLMIVVPTIWLMWRRLPDHRPAGSRRLGRAWLGGAYVGGAALVTFGVDSLLGGTTITQVDPGALAGFLVVNTLTALALEALPEELTFRGYAVDALRLRWGAWATGALVTTAFMAAPGAASVVTWLVGRAAGLDVAAPALAPGGDAASYLVLLAVFGSMLVSLRQVTGSIWACVVAHLVFLTVNRALLSPERYDAGLAVSMPPGAELLVLVYLMLAIIALAVTARWRARRGHPRR